MCFWFKRHTRRRKADEKCCAIISTGKNKATAIDIETKNVTTLRFTKIFWRAFFFYSGVN